MLLEAARAYDHSLDAALYTDSTRINILLRGSAFEAFLVRGQVLGALEFAARIAEVWRQEVFALGAEEKHVTEHYFCQVYMWHPLIRLGFASSARELALALRLDEWEGRMSKLMADAFRAFAVNSMGGESEYNLWTKLICGLPAVLAAAPPSAAEGRRQAREPHGDNGGSSSGAATTTSTQEEDAQALLESEAEVLLVLQAREEVLRAADHYGETILEVPGIVEFAALAAERCGDGELAAFYAEEGKERYLAKPQHQASCRLVLGRVKSGRKDFQAARQERRAAARGVIKARLPLLALRIAKDDKAAAAAEEEAKPPDEEMEDLLGQACELLGRNRQELESEFDKASTAVPGNAGGGGANDGGLRRPAAPHDPT